MQKAYSRLQDVITLKASNRRWMNFLVELMNKQLVSLASRFFFMWPSSKQLSQEAAIARAGDKVKFVDYDDLVGTFNGRFCEPGVDESTVDSNTR